MSEKTGPIVKLYTADAEPVATETILPFADYPDVILYGARVFRHIGFNWYVECFAFSIPYPGAYGEIDPQDQRSRRLRANPADDSTPIAPPTPEDSHCTDAKNSPD